MSNTKDIKKLLIKYKELKTEFGIESSGPSTLFDPGIELVIDEIIDDLEAVITPVVTTRIKRCQVDQ